MLGLGPLSNREPQYQNQNTLIVDGNGRIRFAALSRRALALPLEILAAIFIHCLPQVEFVKPKVFTAPLLLCGVCRQWREVALTTPELWSSLSWTQFTAGTDDDNLCWTWLSRARSRPLSLQLQDVCLYRSEAPTRLQLFRQTLAESSPLMRNVHIDVGPYLGNFFPLEECFPLLEKLVISLPDDALPISFHDAPKLREVHLTVDYRVDLELPWQQLTTFRSTGIAFGFCLEILRDACNLVDGSFKIVDLDAPETLAITISPLIHLHLQSLALSGFPDYDGDVDSVTIAILDYLNAPALKNFTLKVPVHLDTLDITIPIIHIPVLLPTAHLGVVPHPRTGVRHSVPCSDSLTRAFQKPASA
ncbi:hypothetical protein C8R44DRAFT_975836 [Mycena epipterygia]|nr:hypothetical protein C8R44DRAFT_975836 [Mycena epipterygia]